MEDGDVPEERTASIFRAEERATILISSSSYYPKLEI
jgi:hypothetical protein